MYNLLIALGIGAVAFGAGSLATNTIVAGVVPALLASGIAYFLLARRTLNQFSALIQADMGALQAKLPTARSQQEQQAIFSEGRQALEKGFALKPWQFGIASQVHTQIGSIAYMQKDFDGAYEHLSKADSWMMRMTAWQPMAMLALIEYRRNEPEAAVKRLSKLTTAGGKDALFWALYATVANRAKQTEVALKAVSEGLEKVKGSAELTTLADQLRNKKRLTPEIFGEMWLQFFPDEAEQIIRSSPALYQKMMAAQQAANGPMQQQQPDGMKPNRAQRRAAKKNKGKKIDHPRY